MSALLAVRGARVRYGDREVLHGVDVDVHAGELLAVLGANGSGKSTLLLLFAGLLAPTGGEARLDIDGATIPARDGGYVLVGLALYAFYRAFRSPKS